MSNEMQLGFNAPAQPTSDQSMVMSSRQHPHKVARTHDFLNTRKNYFYSKTLMPNENGCMLWSGSKNKKGYGTMYGNEKKMILASRFSFALHFGPFDASLCVLHHCDIPGCVAPGHLFLGTKIDNMRDCSAKNRIKIPGFKGEDCGQAKLTNLQVSDIKLKIERGEKMKDLAKLYGVHYDTICAIKTGKNWGHIQ